MDFDKRKAVLQLCVWLMEHKYCSFERMNDIAPRDLIKTLPNEQKIDKLIEALDIQQLINQMGLGDYNQTAGTIPLDWFKWSR